MSQETKPLDEDFALTEVPAESRRGFWSMFVVMLGFTFFSASMWVGAGMGAGLTLSNFILAMLAGNLILGVYTSTLAYMASKTGLSVHLLCRYSFGVKGSWLPSAILAITQIGWFGVGVAMFAIPVQKWLAAKGVNCNIWLPIVLSGVAFTASAYFGIKALAIVSIIAVPAVAIGGGFSAIKVFADNPNAWQTLVKAVPESSISLGAAIAMAVGSFISGGSCTPDFARFAKNTKTAISTTAIAFFIGNSLMFMFGAVGGMFYKTNDISEVMVAQGLLLPACIVLGLNIWTTNDNALYTSGLGISNITGFAKKKVVIFNGVLGTVLAMFLYNNFVAYLNFLNSMIPPVGAVLAADFFLFRKQKYESLAELKSGKAVNVAAVLAWLCGVLTANFVHCGISSINGMVVTFLVYWAARTWTIVMDTCSVVNSKLK
ncbi:MAG: cytosine permease [Victivallales bacterium]|nr:cytosine permease [Victivallales bacterium]